jgi:hypothetical protein
MTTNLSKSALAQSFDVVPNFFKQTLKFDLCTYNTNTTSNALFFTDNVVGTHAYVEPTCVVTQKQSKNKGVSR